MSETVQSAGPAAESVSELRESVAGAVIGPTDASYDGARRCFNALVDRRPAVIVRCFGAADVATAFDFARAQGLDVAVRGGGHNPAGHCVLDGGLVIDLSLLRRVEVDGEARVARSAGGATWLDSTRRRRPSASSRRAASWVRPAWPASPSAAASATSPPSMA
jgi:hypothetical protein